MSEKKHAHRPHKKEESQGMRLLHASLWGVGGFLIGSVLLLFLGSLLCIRLPDPAPFLLPISLIALYLPTFAGGFVAARKYGGAALSLGALTGLWIFLLTFLLALLLPGKSTAMSFALSCVLRLLLPLCSVLGSLIGVNIRKTPHRRRR